MNVSVCISPPTFKAKVQPKIWLEKFKKWIENEVAGKLNKNGILCVAYLFWTYFEKRKDIPLINQRNILDKYFKGQYEQWIIDNSFIEDTTNDKILIYHKK